MRGEFFIDIANHKRFGLYRMSSQCVCLHVYQSAAAGVNMAVMIPLLCLQLHPKPQSKPSVNHEPILIRAELY